MEGISDIDVYEFEWGQGGVESLILTKLVGGLVPLCGFGGGGGAVMGYEVRVPLRDGKCK